MGTAADPADDEWRALRHALDAATDLKDLEQRIADGYARAMKGPQRGAVAFAHAQAFLRGADADRLDDVQKERLRVALSGFVAADAAESARIAELLGRLG